VLTLNSEIQDTADLEKALENDSSCFFSFEPFVEAQNIDLLIKDLEKQSILAVSSAHSLCGTSPHYIQNIRDIPKDTFFILTSYQQVYTAYLCLSHHDMTVSLAFNPQSKGLQVQAYSGFSREANKRRAALVVCRGDSLDQVSEQLMKMGLSHSGGLGKLRIEKPPLPEWLQGIGLTASISNEDQLSHDYVINAVKTLRKESIPLSFLILAEGWQDVSTFSNREKGSVLQSFSVDLQRFPLGLKGLADELREYGVIHLGVTHTMMGASDGLSEDLARSYGLPPDNTGRYFLGYDLGKTFAFFHDYYSHLRDQNVTFIKVSEQSRVKTFMRDGMDQTQLYKNLQTSIQAAASIQFNTVHFNSESLIKENLFYWITSRITQFDSGSYSGKASTPKVIRNSLINSVWLGHLMQPEGNLWAEESRYQEMQAIYLALSSAFINLDNSSLPQVKKWVDKMLLPSGRKLNADSPLKPCEKGLFTDPLQGDLALKAYTQKGANGILSVFNLSSEETPLDLELSPSDIPYLKAKSYAVYSYRQGFIGLCSASEQIQTSLDQCMSDVFTFAPIKNGVAVLGSLDYFLMPGPIKDLHVSEEAVTIHVLENTSLFLYSEKAVYDVKYNSRSVPWEYDRRNKTLHISSMKRRSKKKGMVRVTFEG
jgi:hypothetical protein